jgi:5-(carboxyamino)imidazole ribonucleotide mutase
MAGLLSSGATGIRGAGEPFARLPRGEATLDTPSPVLRRLAGLDFADFEPGGTFERGVTFAPDLVFFCMEVPERLAGIYQDRIVHSEPLATPCRSLGRSYNPAYVFGFPKRIDRMTAPVAIIMGSQSDWATMRHTADTLTALGVPCEKHIVSAHRTPDRLFAFAKGAQAAGFKIIIAGAGGAAHLPGMTASLTELPVFGVPIESKALSGIDSLYSIVQMPAGIPVGTLAIGKPGAINAALLAAGVLALNDPALAGRLVAWRKQQTDAVKERPEESA